MNGRIRAAALASLLVVAACGGGPTQAPGSGLPAASPTQAGSVDGEALAASFVRILTDPALQAGVVQQATATTDLGGEVLDFRVSMSGDIALPDMDLEIVIEADGQSTRTRVVVVGERSFIDLGEGWIEAPPGSVDAGELATAFAVVTDPDDLDFAGSQDIDGTTLYHLVATRSLPYTPAGFEGTGAGTGTMDDLDAYVEADGTPVRVELSFTAAGTAGGQAITVHGTTEIRFSDVGGDQEIVPPSVAPSAGA
jgi:hypothetical protein